MSGSEMSNKISRVIINTLIVMVLVIGSQINGPSVANAAPALVTAAITPSTLSPSISQTITIMVNIDMSSSGGQSLGSYTGSLAWNPAVLAYTGYTGAPPTGFTGMVNTASTVSGLITFNGASVSGATGNTIVLLVTFNVIGGGNAALNLDFSSMAASATFASLLPILSITQTAVTAVEGYLIYLPCIIK